MTTVRPQASGPKWRAQESLELDPEQTFVFCCCGVAMRFHWPRGSESVRCFGCGARFDRPDHFPAHSRLIWEPPPAASAPRRALLTRVRARPLLGVALGVLALGLLTTGLVLLWS